MTELNLEIQWKAKKIVKLCLHTNFNLTNFIGRKKTRNSIKAKNVVKVHLHSSYAESNEKICNDITLRLVFSEAWLRLLVRQLGGDIHRPFLDLIRSVEASEKSLDSLGHKSPSSRSSKLADWFLKHSNRKSNRKYDNNQKSLFTLLLGSECP